MELRMKFSLVWYQCKVSIYIISVIQYFLKFVPVANFKELYFFTL